MDISLIRRRLDHIRFYTGRISQRRDGDCRKYIQVCTINFLFARIARLEYGEDWSQTRMQQRRVRTAIDVRLLADEKGIEECLSLKGSSGSKPCCFCRNVLGRADLFDHHPHFVHLASTDVTSFCYRSEYEDVLVS